MKKTLVALSLAAMTLPALAQDKKAPEPDYTITGNFGLFSDYKFRGISQTNNKPAAQGGFDFAHKSGIYVGTWTSNVSQWTAAGASQEIDLYGGLKGNFSEFGYDVGYIAYQYPGNTANPKNNTREVYIGVTYGSLSYKISRSQSNWFGIAANSDGSIYHDLKISYPLSEKVTINFHAGMQKIENDTADYKDYSLGLGYDLGNGYSLGLAYISTSFDNNTRRDAWAGSATNTANAKLYESKAVASITKTF
ncbi:MAG: TorF family putative porin [Burkholderiaceae bacterium]|jgi:uncharacterized protein (TIGR02001 family)